MEFGEVVRRRRMVRNFDPTPVPQPVVARMLEHAQRAPSAGNSQGWAFLALTTPAAVTTFWEASSPDPHADNRWLRGMRSAPVIIVPFAHEPSYAERYAEPDKHRAGASGRTPWPIPYWYCDTAMASLLMLLTATDEGLGACFFGVPGERHRHLSEAFDVPQDYEAIGAIAVGYRTADAGSPGSGRRGRRDDVVHWQRWAADAPEGDTK